MCSIFVIVVDVFFKNLFQMFFTLCWYCVHSQEMLISPTLLDFLEQALEPIPMSAEQQTPQPKTPNKACELHMETALK